MRLSGIPEVDVALRELYAFMELYTTKSLDFHGRRIRNASPSQLPFDYVVRKELPDLVQSISATTRIIQGGGGGVTSVNENVVFGIGVGVPVEVGNNATPPRPWVNTKIGRPLVIVLVANTGPTGADLRVDIKKDGVSIFTAGYVSMPAGTGAHETVVLTGVFENVTFSRYEVLTCDVIQVGSSVPGQDINIFIFCSLT